MVYDPEVPPFNWTGFFIGVHGGYGWNDTEWTLVDNAGPGACGLCGTVVAQFNADGFLGGIQAGYNHQFDRVVVGVEADISITHAEGDDGWLAMGGTAPRDVSLETRWLATLGPRLGVAIDRTLVYGEGGLAAKGQEFRHRNLVNGRVFEDDEVKLGWFVGAGIEQAFLEKWSFKLEYNFIGVFDDGVTLQSTTGGVPRRAKFDVEQHTHVVKAGINRRF